jgi:hypothetical protein
MVRRFALNRSVIRILIQRSGNVPKIAGNLGLSPAIRGKLVPRMEKFGQKDFDPTRPAGVRTESPRPPN